jgi:AraC family transcriptional regulator, regulatory protein of adaptative response / methylated-DNA-[protein]-cysteine methyltransferase
MGMSPAHFQRIFSQWVGVSPKRYQQYLTLDHARRLLADRITMLDAAAEAAACRAPGGCTTCSCGGRR